MSKWWIWIVVALLTAALSGGTWYLYSHSPQQLAETLPSFPGLQAKPSAMPEDVTVSKREVTLFLGDPATGALVKKTYEIQKQPTLLAEITQTVALLIQPEPEAETRNAAFPEGAQLLNAFVTGGGGVYLNMNRNLQDRHVGGLDAELATVTALVNTMLLNFKEITYVQILVEGAEIETLAGHVDCRKPFSKLLLLES